MIKVLIIGLGSIGQRHANALIVLGINNIAALRTGKGQKEIDLEILRKIKIFSNEQEAFAWKPTHMIISNPTSLHLDFIKKAILANIKFFVEKPITDKLNNLELNIDIKNVNGVVGYNLRFHALFQFIKNIIVSKEFGRIITAHLHVGQYLPNWHPYEDYREAYYSKQELGGGALKTLSHEVDLMQFLFGKVETVFAKVQKLSDLEINVDDVTNIIAKTQYCQQVNVHINFLDPNIRRTGMIYFSEGVLEYDFMKSFVTFTNNSGRKTTIYEQKDDLNRQYQSQMREFLASNKSKYCCTFEEGVDVLNIIDMCIKSNIERKELCLI